MRFVRVTLILAGLLASVVLVLPAGAAGGGSCEVVGADTVCTFEFTDAEQTFVVPASVTSVRVLAQGAAGAPESDEAAAGRGGTVTDELTVTAGQTLYVEVGGPPTTGDCGDDDISGKRGNDRITGQAGDDTASGGRGADSMSGGPGSDRIRGFAGNDRLSGGSGADLLLGGTGDDSLSGGPNHDDLRCGPGQDSTHDTAGDNLGPSCEGQ